MVEAWVVRIPPCHRVWPLTLVGASLLMVSGACDPKADENAETKTSPPAAPSDPQKPDDPEPETPKPASTAVGNTCSGTYPSYWQDPKFAEQWEGQQISDAPPEDWEGPVFKLSDKFPTAPVDDAANQPWRDSKFDALFAENTPADQKQALAKEYGWLVMDYIQAGNTGQQGQEDWNVCDNPIRPWYNIPFQTYDPLSGREFTHGLTREAPVTFATAQNPKGMASTMWAIGFFNATAAATLGEVWKADGKPVFPTADISFAEGAVVGKPLFNTLTADDLPFLANMPSWKANISAPDFCSCPASSEETRCTLVEESKACPRSTTKYGPVSLLQFDFAVKDSRAPGTKWVFGTFVADGVRKQSEPDPWKRIALLGVMWGNDTPPQGQLAYNYPADPKKEGFAQEVIFWDTVAMLNEGVSEDNMLRPGHLGCNFRLNGPADNANSSCMSCHGTASVPDANEVVPPLLSQFSAMTNECVTPDAKDPSQGKDRSGTPSKVSGGVPFASMDGIYFANTPAAKPFNIMAQVGDAIVNIMGDGVPSYEPPHGEPQTFISLDYSLQLSISLVEWDEWQDHVREKVAVDQRVHRKNIRRNE